MDGINTETTVTFTANASAATVSSLSSDVPTQVADGSSAITFTAVLKDGSGNLVAEAPVAFSTTGGTLAQPSVTTNAQGEARVTLTSTQAGEVTVSAKAQDNAADRGQSQAVTFTANASAAAVSSLSSDVPTQVADGSSAITFTAVLKDGSGNLVAEAPVAFSTTGGTLAQTSVTTNAQGEARVTLTSTQAGEVTVSAKAQDNAADGGQSQAVTFTANASAAAVSSLSSDVPTQVADGSSAITFTAVLKDGSGNLVAEAPVAFSTTGGTLAQPSVTTNAQGEARVTLTSTQAGEVTVSAKAQDNAADGGQSQAVTFTANASAAAVSSLSSDVPTQVADGSSAITFTAVLKDGSGNLVAEAPVAFSTTGGTLAQTSVTTNAQGEARVTLTSTQVGEVTVSAKAQDNAADGGQSQAVTFIANASAAAVSSLSSDVPTQVADGSSAITFTAVLKDGSGNLVAEAPVAFSTTGGTLAQTSVTTNAQGEARVTLTSTQAGEVTVSAKAQNNPADGGQSQAVTFTANASAATVSSLSSDVPTQVADGSSAITFTAVLKDGSGNLVAEAPVAFSTTGGTLAQPSVTTNAQGEARVTLTSTQAGEVTVSAKAQDNAADGGQSQAVTFTANASAAAVSSLSSDVPTQVADGSSAITFTAVLKDGSGNLVAEAPVAFSTTGGTLAQPSVTTNAQGEARVTLTSTQAGEVTVSAKAQDNAADGGQSQAVTFTANASAAAVSSLSSDVPTQVADGSSAITFTAVLKDGSGNLVAEAPVAFSTTGGTLAQTSVTTNAQGEARVTLTSTQAGEVTVSAKAQDNAADGGQSQAVTFTANASAATVSSLSSDVPTQVADGSSAITFTAVLKDGSGNLVAEAPVAFSTTGGTLAQTSVTTNAQGEARVTLTSTQVGEVTVSAKAQDNAADGGQSQAVTFIANASAAAVSSLSSDVPTQVADGSSAITFTAVLKDGSGNLVAEAPVAFSTTGGTLAQPSVTTNAQGEARVTLTSTQVGEVTVSAKAQDNAADGGQSQAVTFIAVLKIRSLQRLNKEPQSEGFSPNEGFPTTAVKDGKTYFSIKLEGGQEQSKKWSSSDSSVATVDSSGHVMLAGNKGNVTITISDDISKTNYSFTIKKVFTLLTGPAVSQVDAQIQCSKVGLSLPLVEDITNGGTTNPYKAVGNLWGEWGDFPALWGLSQSQYIYTGTADSNKYTMVNGMGIQTSYSYSVSHTSQFSCI
ncbi:beta strand repeat-containing protein [Serratia rhizosphaerae]|uniref:beta strand repeat-containing protein n=1 Tax=Serratia rhizosphaerae TaxID=2597702 RepID=UPI001FE74185|nr:Ig-like domain-containing protein [Serratia rhizosphaerae]